MRSNLKKRMLSAATAAGLVLSGLQAARAQDKPQSVGMGIFTFTSGPAAAYGMPARNAAELWIDQLNAAGGIDGVKIDPKYIDEAQGTNNIIGDYRHLAEDPNNQVMIAALSSGNCLALHPIANQLKVPTVGWNCDTHQLFEKERGGYYFRPNGNTIPEFTAFAVYLLSVEPDIKTVAIIDPDYAFGHDGAQIFTAALKALKPDVQIVAELYPRLGAASYQTEISRLAVAHPEVIFSNLWGGDLENFIRQAEPRGLFKTSKVVLALGESVLQTTPLPDGVIVGVLGDGYWMSPQAESDPAAKAFVKAYHQRFGLYPVFPAMKMANALEYVKVAYQTAMRKNGGKWPSREELDAAMNDSTVKTYTGTTVTRSDNDGVVDQIVGQTVKSSQYPFPVMGDMARYSGETLMPPEGQDPIKWLGALTPSFVAEMPKPGSYK